MNNMNYKLAKQLKEAGFPQELKVGDRYYENVGENRKEAVTNVSVTMVLTMCVKIPTLSELIEACGDGFRALRLDSSMKTENNEQWACDRVEHGVFETFIGKTPEEAVAKLYIKLNKK